MSETAPLVRVVEIEAFERDVKLRLPFRFGVITLREAPQALVRVRVAGEDGKTATGCAAEMMMPKWFDKRPELTPEENVEQLRASIRAAAEAAIAAPAATLFGAARRNESEVSERLGENRLVAGFGPALIARAALDAWCRLAGMSFHDAVRRNLIGMGEHLPPDLDATPVAAVLRALTPASTIAARHTIGLLDPLTEAEIVEPLNDGLPQSLDRHNALWTSLVQDQAIGGCCGGSRSAATDRVRARSWARLRGHH